MNHAYNTYPAPDAIAHPRPPPPPPPYHDPHAPPPPSLATPPVQGNRSQPPPESHRADAGKSGAVSKMRKPRKGNNAGGGKSSLFWVHTDSQSVSEGTREDTLKRIRSHVMSEHNRKKRLENTKRYKTKAWKHLAFQPVETSASTPSATAALTASTEPPALTKTTSPGSRETSASSSPGHIPPERRMKGEDSSAGLVVAPVVSAGHIDNGHRVSPVRVVSPWDYVGQGAQDPFCLGHTRLSDRMMRHLQHFLCNLTQIAYPLQRRYGPKLQAHWSTLVQQDPASLHACICVAASNMALQAGEFPLKDPNNRSSSPLLLDTFHHRGETIRLVNEGLSDPIKASSDVLIAAVSILLTIEIASGNPDYLKIHLAGLRQMVGMRNSFADVPPDVRFQISWTDIRVACMAFTRPIFPFIRYARPTHLSVRPPSADLSNTAARLIALTEIPGIFGPALTQTIYDLGELTWWAEWIKSDPTYQDFGEETEDYFNTEVLYIEYALHTDRYTDTGASKGDASIEGCVRLASLLFHNSAIWDFYPQIAPVFPKPITGLQKAIETTIPAGCFHLCRDLLIWLLFMGACASRLMVRERAFFVAELAAAVQDQGLHSWQELRTLLLGFFYVDRTYLGPLREVWDEVQMRPPQYLTDDR
ncbi:uncharacterized protein BDW47DRAFT_116745 [Aspergillus candidus]|uniref:Uncharacterized protein n=1 Tax=Aspergillus candidus TaxID=41067 RepID=A0A2I2FET2_ASPCN|nr:hypothetical protein BDW47DRAFT_116745 [Aspergillus candidus]PLB39089.1 hypothetical protein BDW47DRAFT_116745 [Aspergillus candidus]